MNRKILAAIAAAVVAALAVAVVMRPESLDPQRVGPWLAGAGHQWWAPVAFILLYILFNVLLMPATILTLTAGVVWGWFAGGVWVLLASTIASAVPYWIARTRSPWVEAIMRRGGHSLRRALAEEGFMTLLLLRLIPIIPYNVLNYAAGLASIRARDYLAATLIGTIPGIFIFTYFASALSAGVVTPREALGRVVLAGTLLAALALVSRLFAGRVRSRLRT